MKRTDIKSHCPVNFTLEAVGDPWTLLILRDIAFFEKKTFKDFLASPERITTSVLTNRLSALERNGILIKHPHATDLRSSVYMLTQKGLELIPLLLNMVEWGTKHDPQSTGYEYKSLLHKFKKSGMR